MKPPQPTKNIVDVILEFAQHHPQISKEWTSVAAERRENDLRFISSGVWEAAMLTLLPLDTPEVTQFLVGLFLSEPYSINKKHEILSVLVGRPLPDAFVLELLAYQRLLRTQRYEDSTYGRYDATPSWVSRKPGELIDHTFGQLKPSEDKYLFQYLESEQDAQNRCAAARALGRLRTPDGEHYLMRVVRESLDEIDARLIALDEAHAGGGDGLLAAKVELITSNTLNAAFGWLAAGIDGLGLSRSAMSLPLLSECLKYGDLCPNRTMRRCFWNVVPALAMISTPESIPLLLSLLTGPKTAEWEEVASVLWQTRNPVVVEPLIELLKHEDCGVRGAAAYSLGQLGDPRACPPLRALLDDDWPASKYARKGKQVRHVAKEALEKLGEKHRFKFTLVDNPGCTICERRMAKSLAAWIETDYFVQHAEAGWRPARLHRGHAWPDHANSCPYDYWVVCPECRQDYVSSGGRTEEPFV